MPAPSFPVVPEIPPARVPGIPSAKGPEIPPAEEPELKPRPPFAPFSMFLRWWRYIGGGSLSVSIAIHVAVLVAAAFIYTAVYIKEPEVDFLPGGSAKGSGAQERSYQMQNKR